MTAQHQCKIYYSVSGDPFAISDREKEHIEHTDTILNIYTREEGEIADVNLSSDPKNILTELSVPYPIRKEQFFNSESFCLFINEAGQVLKIGDNYLFKVSMMRHAGDYERLHIKFENHYYEGEYKWWDID